PAPRTRGARRHALRPPRADRGLGEAGSARPVRGAPGRRGARHAREPARRGGRVRARAGGRFAEGSGEPVPAARRGPARRLLRGDMRHGTAMAAGRKGRGRPRAVPRPEGPARPAGRLEDEDMPAPDDALLLKMLHSMKLTRALEYRIERKLYRQGKIVGGVYVGRGQEAISVGAAVHIRRGEGEDRDDIVSPSHRDMAVFLMQG